MGTTVWTTRGMNGYSILTKREYVSAGRAPHSTVRKFLFGCRCERCDTPANHRFAYQLRNGPWSTSA